MNKGLVALAGIGAGAGIMYLADSREGRRRARADTARPVGVAPGRD
jgi:hypothetical protein